MKNRINIKSVNEHSTSHKLSKLVLKNVDSKIDINSISTVEHNLVNFACSLIDSELYQLALKVLDQEPYIIYTAIPNIFLSVAKLELFSNISKGLTNELDASLNFLEGSYNLFEKNFHLTKRRIELLIKFPNVLESNFYIMNKEKEFKSKVISYLNDFLQTEEDISDDALESIDKEIVFYEAYFTKNNNFSTEYLSFIPTSFSEYSFSNDFSILKNNLEIKEDNVSVRTNRNRDKMSDKSSKSNTQLHDTTAYTSTNNNIQISPIFSIQKVMKEYDYSKSMKQSINEKLIDNKMIKSKITKLSIMNDFCFKNIKREKIDKLVIRRFINYVSEINNNFSLNSEFLINFANSNFKPPFSNEEVAFKSINTGYLVWLFQHEDVKILFQDFINDELKIILVLIFESHNQSKKSFDEEQIKFYLEKYIDIYSNKS